jgi:uncharacterized membrane-anchored protein YitT (DUF2179 family)
MADASHNTFKHSWYEDLFGLATGSILLGIGIAMLDAGGVLTGGTVGVAQLLAHSLSLSVSQIYVLVSVPFFVLGIWKKGFVFATRSFINIVVVSFLVKFFADYIHIETTNKLVLAIVANTILGMGVLAIFRHNSSLGGFNIIALIAQEKLKIQAGIVQAGMDLTVLLTGLIYYSMTDSIHSLIGVLILNGILALNHRSDRYIGTSK